MKTEAKILRFLLDMNKLMDGLHIEEITEYVDMGQTLMIKFEAKLTCPYAIPGMWSPSELFYSVMKKCSDKHFEPSTFEAFHFNNTRTVFWCYEREL